MSIDEHQAVKSPYLFEDEYSQETLDAENLPNNELKSFDHLDHWIFKRNTDKKIDFYHHEKRLHVSVKQLDLQLKSLTEKIWIARSSFPKAKPPPPVTAISNTFKNDQIEYLFCNDSMKLAYNMNLKDFLHADDRKPLLEKLKGCSSVGVRFPRRAKEKALERNIFGSSQRNFRKTKFLELPEDPEVTAMTIQSDSLASNDNFDTVNTKKSPQPKKKRKLTDNGESSQSTIKGLLKKIGNNFANAVNVVTGTSKPANNEENVISDDSDEVSFFREISEPSKKKDIKKVNVAKIPCPLCNERFPQSQIEIHAASCFGKVESTRLSRASSRNAGESNGTGGVDYKAWEKACEGLSETNRGTAKSSGVKDDVNVFEAPNKRKYTGICYGKSSKKLSTSSRPLSFKKYYDKNNEKNVGLNNATKSSNAKNFMTDEETEEDVLDYGEYLPSGNAVRKKTNRAQLATSTRTFGGDENNSPEEGRLKCMRCSQFFDTETFGAHTEICLSKRKQQVSFVLSP